MSQRIEQVDRANNIEYPHRHDCAFRSGSEQDKRQKREDGRRQISIRCGNREIVREWLRHDARYQKDHTNVAKRMRKREPE